MVEKIFSHLLDLSIVNANILYNLEADKQLAQLDFRVAMITSLLEGHIPQAQQRYYAPNRALPLRLTEWPFPERIPSDSASAGRPLCEVCRARGKRSQTRYRCKVCHTALHVDSCFETYPLSSITTEHLHTD